MLQAHTSILVTTIIDKIKSIILFSVLITAGLSLRAQPVTPETELDYIIEEFSLPGGRSGNNVNAIVQGPYGFMWFGSHGGLHRYDGYEFVTYKPIASDTIGETTSLTFPYIENLYWDRDNKLWVTTFGGGLFRFDPITEKFKHFVNDPDDNTSISHQRVLCAMEDAHGNLWFGTEHGLNLFDRKTEKFKRYTANPDNPTALHHDDVRTLYVDKQGTLWLGTGFVLYGSRTDGGLSKYNPDTDSFTNYIYDPADDKSIWTSPVRGLLEDSQGNFWVGTIKGLQKMNREKGTFERMGYNPKQPYAPGVNDLENQPVYSILEDKKGGLWVGIIDYAGYPGHLARYDTIQKKTQVLPIQSSVWQLYESTDGTIWVAGAGTSGKVQKITPKSRTYDLLTNVNVIRNAYAKSPLSEELGGVVVGPMNITVNPETGNYWLQLIISETHDPSVSATLEVVLAEYNPQSSAMEFHLLDLNVPEIDWNSIVNQMEVHGLVIDKQGNLWGSFYSGFGVFRYDPKSKKSKQYLRDPNSPNSISSNEIITIMLDSQGEIWAATFESGLNRIDPTTEKITQYHFNTPNFGEFDEPIALALGRDGKILVGGNFVNEGKGFIVEIDPNTNEMRKIPLPRFGPNWLVLSMAQSVFDGSIVMAIGGNMGGLAYFMEADEYIYFRDMESGLPFNNPAVVISDNDGFFWVADVESSLFVRFRDQDDFVFEESARKPTQWRGGMKGANGKLYFLTWEGGWVEIDPDKIKPEVAAVSSKITLVELFVLREKQKPKASTLMDKPIWLMDEITLPSNAESFGFRFSELNFLDKNTQFQYRLYPYEVEWKRSGYSPVANYYRVPAGTYSFEVKSLNISSNIDDVLKLKVVILPPWWRTWWAYGAYGMMFISGVFVADRFQRKRLLAKATADAKEKELAQAKEIEKAYKDLKATQSQLIQSEKMASLGELTAGIAHEIQNPLNFVNNFSEVNKELIAELREEIANKNFSEVDEIAKNVESNEEKIIHHGKRADAIVKGMLQHSKGSSGKKELSDINALCDEYLRLAYHGLRAKDKSFNAKFETDFDTTLEKINVVPQDMGRVVLNLITNAFYVVNEKSKQQPAGYEPTVIVKTKKEKSSVLISVIDNGNGIPEHIKEKIFQPFFTTKPTGQGTGLGLSLSYDIVKAHSGELSAESIEGNGTEFLLLLPLA